MTPLRQKFISTLRLRNYSENTIDQYTKSVAHFAAHFHKCPTVMGASEVKEFLHYLRDTKKASPSCYRQTVAALRCLYWQVLERESIVSQIPYPRREKPVKDFLTPEEMRKVLSSLTDLKYRTMLEVLYGTGVRCGELVRLKISDIDSERMFIVVRDGKGHKGRLTLLSKALLQKLRAYYREYRPTEWLFEGRKGKHSNECVPQRACQIAEKASGLGKRITPTILRRSFASALHEADVDVITISRLLGHVHVQTTGVYTDVTLKTLHRTQSPFDLL